MRLLLKIPAWLLMSSAIIFLTVSFFLYLHTQKFIQSANRTQGIITQLIEKKDHDTDSLYYPVCTFQDSRGNQHQIYSSMGSYPPSYKIGDKISVLYQPNNPEKAMIDNFSEKWFLSAMFAGGGLMDLIFASALFLLLFFMHRKQQPSSQTPI
jgi:Protein of unknown function (DUF3592)